MLYEVLTKTSTLDASAFIFADPALVDLVQRGRVEVVQFFTAAPHGRYEVRRFQQPEMFGHCLPRHVEVAAQFPQRLPVILAQRIEQLPAASIGQRLEYGIHLCRSIRNQMVACQTDN